MDQDNPVPHIVTARRSLTKGTMQRIVAAMKFSQGILKRQQVVGPTVVMMLLWKHNTWVPILEHAVNVGAQIIMRASMVMGIISIILGIDTTNQTGAIRDTIVNLILITTSSPCIVRVLSSRLHG